MGSIESCSTCVSSLYETKSEMSLFSGLEEGEQAGQCRGVPRQVGENRVISCSLDILERSRILKEMRKHDENL